MNRKKVLITGHTSGIGKILTEKLLESNEYEITAIARRQIKNNPFLQQISCDLSQAAEVKKLNHTLSKKKFDILILNAGANNIKPAEAYSIEEIQNLIQLNFTSHALIFKMCINGLIQKKGLVIGIGSYSGKEIKRWNNYYGASKAAFHHLILNMNEQFRKSNVKFSLIIPDVMNTEFYDTQDYKPITENYTLNPNNVATFIIKNIIQSNNIIPLEICFKPSHIGLKKSISI